MVDTVYIEEGVREHPRTVEICARFPRARKIPCQRYSEVFNPKAQNFRLQKKRPALILAKKHNNLVLPAPTGYAVGANHNFYFSHMLNCPYDCRYCFLQGMYQSANYVIFVNYEDFIHGIRQSATTDPDQEIHFFSGYDCDSLALEPITGFARFFVPAFRSLPNAWLELRTKSTQISTLLEIEPVPNCIVAFSFTPDEIAQALEHRVPSVRNRLEAMLRLQESGWSLGLRFDPLIYQQQCFEQYARLFETIFKQLNINQLHSVSLGSFRLPERFFRKAQKLYPKETLFATPMEVTNGLMSYQPSLDAELTEYCTEQLLQHIPADKFFPCTNDP